MKTTPDGKQEKGEWFYTVNKGSQKPWNFFLGEFQFWILCPQTGKSDLNIWKDSYRVLHVQHLRIQDPLHLQDKSGEILVPQPDFSLKLNLY